MDGGVTKGVPIGSDRVAPLDVNLSRALVEAERCLYCFEAPCAEACPVHIDVPGFIKRLKEHNFAGSHRLLVESNPLATVCGLVCPTEELCEGACVLHKTGQTPIRIGMLQYFAARQLQDQEPLTTADAPGGVAVVGGGPSGIGCAVVLRRLGREVHLYEQSTSLGGLMGRVIPAYRLPARAVAHDLARLKDSGIVFHSGTEINESLIEEILDDFDAVFLGIGLEKTADLPVPGHDLEGVKSVLPHLEQVRLHALGEAAAPALGETTVVVGGGNVAVDAALTAKQLGVERSIILYRRTLEEMPAWRDEYLEAVKLGVEFRWLTTVGAIRGENGRVRRVEVRPMRRVGVGPDGRRGVEPDPRADTYEIPCDSVILALGQRLDRALAESLELSVTKDGTIEVDPDSFQTSHPKVFAAGEVASGGSTVVRSLARGMEAGRKINQHLLA
jgi:glutamate synthase (NADPH/NADH) small chain